MFALSYLFSASVTSLLFLLVIVVAGATSSSSGTTLTMSNSSRHEKASHTNVSKHNKKAGREPSYYLQQLVDHVGNDTSPYRGRMWVQRFYSMGTYFGGPGSPIFVYLGGEGSIEPERGLHHYPFITEHIARLFQAFILEPEHRFYGQSQPVSTQEIDKARSEGSTDPRLALLTSEQALHDYIRLTRAVRDQLSCSRDRFSDRYCPVITVGGSYPGWLSAMARLLFPSVVDASYASSAPMKFYAQQVDQNAYYDHITQATDKAFPGCAAAVRKTLDDVVSYYTSSGPDTYLNEYSKIGICPGTLPESYIQDTHTFLDEVVMMAGYTFANMNMAFYPPSTSSSSSSLGRACETFLSIEKNQTSPLEKLAQFFVNNLGGFGDSSSSSSSSSLERPRKPSSLCFNMSAQVPTGPNATISSGDWSGVGTGRSGESWDFQTCTLLVETIGFGNASMFPPREWNMEWMTRHREARFGAGAAPRPLDLVRRWGIDDIVHAGASNILFTNGLVDGWSVSGIQQNLSDTLVALNFPNGAHHSDLSYYYGSDDNATEDIKQGRAQIQTILATWLQDLPGGNKRRVVQ